MFFLGSTTETGVSLMHNPLFIHCWWIQECLGMFSLWNPPSELNTQWDVCLSPARKRLGRVCLITGCWGLGRDYCGWNLAVRTQAVSFSLAERVSPLVIVSLFLTGVLSVSLEVDGFVSVSLLSSTLRPVMALWGRARGVTPQLHRCHTFWCSFISGCSPSVLLFLQHIRLLQQRGKHNLVFWALWLMWTADIGMFT